MTWRDWTLRACLGWLRNHWLCSTWRLCVHLNFSTLQFHPTLNVTNIEIERSFLVEVMFWASSLILFCSPSHHPYSPWIEVEIMDPFIPDLLVFVNIIFTSEIRRGLECIYNSSTSHSGFVDNWILVKPNSINGQLKFMN